MTQNPDDLRLAHAPELRALHEEIVNDESGDDVTDSDSSAFSATLAEGLDGAMLSPRVQDYLDELLKLGENPSPELRQRLVRAAARGIDHQRREATPIALPVLFSERRREADAAPEYLASLLQIPVERLLKFESGAIEVREASPDTIIAWATALKVPPRTTVNALRRALQLTAHAPTALAAGRHTKRDMSDGDRALVDAVAKGLGVDLEQ